MRFLFFATGVIGLFGISASLSAAEPSAQLFGGVEVSTGTSYTYLGHVAPLSGSSFGNGFVRKLWVDWSRYRYDKGGQTYDVSAPGAEMALGYQRASENHWWASYAGLTYRHSSISPDDPTSTIRGGMLRPKFQLEGEQTLDQKWKVSAIGSYITGQRAYWVRGRVLRDAWSDRQIGLEEITQGDPNYHANQFGVLLLGLKASNTVDVGLKAGARRVGGLNSQAYFGIELGGMY